MKRRPDDEWDVAHQHYCEEEAAIREARWNRRIIAIFGSIVLGTISITIIALAFGK